MNLSTLFQSKTFRGMLYGIGIAIVLLLVFEAGVFVGYHKADFSFKWGKNYVENFTGMQQGMMGFEPRGMMNPHGVFGTVIKTDASSVVIKGPDGVEKIVLVKDDTSIRRDEAEIKLADIKTGENLVVIGSPDDKGQIEAKLIRVMPEGMPVLPMPGAVPSQSQTPAPNGTQNPVPDGTQTQDAVTAKLQIRDATQPQNQNQQPQPLPKISQ